MTIEKPILLFNKVSLFFYIFGMADYTSQNLIISTLLKRTKYER